MERSAISTPQRSGKCNVDKRYYNGTNDLMRILSIGVGHLDKMHLYRLKLCNYSALCIGIKKTQNGVKS